MKNLSLLFNKTYYNGLGEDGFSPAAINGEIEKAKFDNTRDYKKSEVAEQLIYLETTYPGLLIGTGNPHGAAIKSPEGDISAGFSFDYVTGQPYIPGSSVKGLLRSAFSEHPDVVAELIEKDEEVVKDLEKRIFDGNDIFLDAVVYDSNEYGRLLARDSITPHSSPTKDPKPVTILKVLPGVKFEFRFILFDERDAEGNSIITAGKKKWLFGEILKLFGIGAKTNVGYGNLHEVKKEDLAIKEKLSEPANGNGNNGGNRDGNNGGNSNGNRGGNNGGNRGGYNGKSNGTAPERVTCPHCQKSNYKYSKDGSRLNTYCFVCKEKLN